MKKIFSVVLAIAMCFLILFPLTSCEKSDNNKKNNGEVVTVVFGTHAIADDDATYIDPATGEYGMNEDDRIAYTAAAEKVKEELGVQIKWVEWSGPVVTDGIYTDILKSLLAGDPICDLALVWPDAKGTMIQQNVFQEIDDYADMFKEEKYSWMWMDKTFGHNYYLSPDRRKFGNTLSFNINMIEAVDSLRDSSGNTIYPTDLYKQGNWNWTTFKDYLTKVNAYYSNKASTVTQNPISAFMCELGYAVEGLVHGNGGYVFSKESKLGVADNNFIETISYIKSLSDTGLYKNIRYTADNPTSVSSSEFATKFANNESVFTNLPNWNTGYYSSILAKRGESVGLVPYPINENNKSDKLNGMAARVSDGCAVVRGLSEDRTKLVLEAFRMYYHTYYCEKYNIDSMENFAEKVGEQAAVADGYDVYHDKIGNDILNIYKKAYSEKPSEYSTVASINMDVTEIISRSLYNLGLPEYSVAIKSQLPMLQSKIDAINDAIASGKLQDKNPPIVEQAKIMPVKKGSRIDDIKSDFAQYVNAEDPEEGKVKNENLSLDASGVNFNKVGIYETTVTAKDGSGNEGKGTFKIAVYDSANKTAPNLVIKEPFRVIQIDEDINEINWGEDFIKSATDANGLDIVGNIKVDTGDLDTSIEGTYKVTIVAEDFAGNKTSKDINVVVVNY